MSQKAGFVLLSLDDPDWLSWIQAQPGASIFHHPVWAKLLAEVYGYRPFALAQPDGAGKLAAGLPMLEVRSRVTGHRYVSIPFTDYCPPLVQDGANPNLLLASLEAWRDSCNQPRVEIHGELPNAQGTYTTFSAVRHVLALEDDYTRVFGRFKRTQVQKRIEKAQRDRVEASVSRSAADLRTFYQLHLRTRQRLGTPIQPRRFFDRLWNNLIQKEFGFVILAHLDSRPIAGAVFLAWNGTLIYKYSASDPAYWQYRPNNLVLWTAIRWGCENGYRLFDFGKTELENQGLRDFKNGWGTTEIPLGYTYFAPSPPPRKDSKRVMLSALIQHSPRFVCRTIGELLYGHFA